ncbi:hypothetical protein SDC9_127420 [bioreactor metagenome]|uniref:Uncharacterized protein n=1 Tax=bioreactor metagenome TaxID=1076179 RepID=A0A645CTY6_9ZZZZ
MDFDKAVKEGGVTAEVSCKLSNHLKDNTFIYVISQIQIINPINNIRYELSFPESYLMVRVSGDTILQTEFLTELFPFYLHEEPNLEPDEYEVTVPIPVVPLPMVEPSSKTNGFSLSEIASESSGEIASEIIVSQVEQDAYEEKVFPSYVKKAVVEIGEPVGLRDSNTVRVSKSNITLPQVPSLESDTTSNTPNGFGVGWSIGVFSYTLDMYYSSQGIQLSISLGKAWNNYMNISGVMLCEFESFTGKNNPFHLYIGFGEIAIFEITPSSVVVSSIGLVMPIHLSYFTDSTKWEIFGRLSPGVVINFQSTATSEASFVFEAALGVTYYF